MLKCVKIKRTFSGEQRCENAARYISAGSGAPLCGLCELDVGDGVNISRDRRLRELVAYHEDRLNSEEWNAIGKAVRECAAILRDREAIRARAETA